MLDWEMMAPLHAMLAAVYQDFQAVVRRYSPPADAG
jgi:hypothetical protein